MRILVPGSALGVMFVVAAAFGGGGGCSSSGAATDGATTDGPTFTGWHSLTPSPLPTAWPQPRADPGIAFDEPRGKLIMFGGHRDGYGSDEYETWELDVASGSWTNRTVVPRPASWPTERDSPVMAYDSSVGRIVLFGGGNYLRDLWEWDGAAGTWSERTPALPLSASWPSGRGAEAVAYDTKRARLVLFGGLSGSGVYLQDLWEWDGKLGVWSDRTPSPLPSSWPAKRDGHQLAYDPTRGVVTLFGGFVNDNGQNDTWDWDGAAGTWTERTPPAGAPNPAARFDHAMAFDARRGRIVLFGGRRFLPFVVFDETWEWNGSEGRWTDLTPAPLPASWPSGRMFVAGQMCFASKLGRVVLLGGVDVNSVVHNDLWEWWGF